MRVFVTGASGWIGSAVTAELLGHGHDVVGLVRSDASAAKIEAVGAQVRRGTLDDLDGLAAGAKDSDAVVHLAMNHDFTDAQAAAHTEHDALSAMLQALKGSDRPFLMASGVGGFPEGRPVTEDDRTSFHGRDSMRGGGENLTLGFADQGVRAMALRLAVSVHGAGDRQGFVAVLASIAKERGFSAYIGDGSNRWPAVHRADAARAARLALEKAPAGFRVHAIAEEGIPTRDVAEAIGTRLGLPTRSISAEEAEEHFGWLAGFIAFGGVATSFRTRETLGWVPEGPTLLEDIAGGAYDPR